MFKGSYQKKLFTILYSGGSKPLEIWNIQARNGWTRRVKDEYLGSLVFEIVGTNIVTVYIVTPPEPRMSLGITLPFLVMFIKNLKRYFTFEIQILDDKQMRRRFQFSNYQSSTKVRPFSCNVPISLEPGWNLIQLNLANFTTRAYGTNYLETQRVQIHANCRIRRIYFSDRLYAENELPKEYRVYPNGRILPPKPDTMPPHPTPPTSLHKVEMQERVSTDRPLSILIQPPKTKDIIDPLVTSETVISKTSFKSMPTVSDQQSDIAIPSQSSVSRSVQSFAMAVAPELKYKEEELQKVPSGDELKIVISPETTGSAERTVTFSLGETEPPEEIIDKSDNVQFEQEEASDLTETKVSEKEEVVLEESTEVETPRTEPEYAESEPLPESEYAESEPMPESEYADSEPMPDTDYADSEPIPDSSEAEGE